MQTKSTKPYRHCPNEEYEISIFICRGRQKTHYPKCPECEFRTTTVEIPPVPAKKKKVKPQPPAIQPKTGSIMVKSVPPSAVIFLDDENIGVTPAIITQIFPGKYKIKIKLDGYNVWNQSVDVKASRETSLTAVLQGQDCTVAIESKPANAVIYIDGNNVGVTPATIDSVKTGQHLIEVKLDGYEIWSKEINVVAKKKTSLTAELTTKFGTISLSSEPTNAKIFIDGIEVGTTPARLESVLHGPHLVEVKMDGYSVLKKNVNVGPGKETVLTAKLQVNTGSVSIKSQPKSANIYLDGKHIGITPETITSINPGIHEIKVKMENYDVWSDTINIETGKESDITAMLQRSTGSLMVESDPTNAMILVDGKEVGLTPEIIMSSAKGTHAIEVRMDGYDIWKKEVDIEPGVENALTAILQIKTGSLIINSKPSGGTIFLNGEETGTTPGNLKGLKLGTHQIEVKMDGYEVWSESTEICTDREKKLTAELQILSGSLNVNSQPANATIVIDGSEVGNSPTDINDLKPGKHLVEVKMDGYKTWSESVEISADKENKITAELQILVGSLNVNSQPTNATIIIDGNEVGNTPTNVSDLKPGKYLVEVKMDRYKNWSESVEINAGKANHITAMLQQLVGSVNIKSEPSKAIVIVDGKEVGNTPVDVGDLMPGTHLVEINMEDYETWSKNVEIVIGKNVDLTAMLQLKTGSFTIISEPAETTIYIDGKEVGTTPLTIDAPSPGKHSVEARLDGYETWSRSIDFVQGKPITLTATLQIKPGTVSITSAPSNATTFIDSKEVGITPVVITDPSPGTHTVELKMDGYERWSKSIDIVEGKETVITADLQMKAGSISVNSKPQEAIIYIDGKKSGKTPETITDLIPGTHLVKVIMNGYEDWSESVDIIGDKKNTLTAELLKITGSINVSSNPPEAAIYLDGEKVGATPDSLQSVAIGAHEVEVKMEGFAEWKKEINVKKGKELALNVALQPNTGTASIESDPAEAVTLLDGNNIGNTPVSLTGIKIGIHEVELQKEGYVSCKKTIKIKAGRVNSLTAKLIEMTGSVSVDSKPSNAIVCVNGKKIGNTPATITELAAGKYQLEVTMDCYETWSDSISINPGKESTITAELQPKAGSVSINSNPSNAIILIDNKEVGTTPKIIT
ncbi:MAG: PEGA domain-containing protein, partial [Candidatus Brocadiales bacterium]|nr:PEGA domain-containing protein [Candidatus Brocadiales bacterium]